MFDLSTMASLGLLLPVGGSGGLYTPFQMTFGPDGNLYITGGTLGGDLGVRRFDPTTGAFIDFFANTGGGNVPTGVAFGPDNNLYVSTTHDDVMRFNYPSGTFRDFFVPNGSGGLTRPWSLTFAPDLRYTLHRDCLNDVIDSGLSWQIEGGKVFENGTHVADYSSVKRVSCGTTSQNTAQLWVTLFYIGKTPPENMTLHGAHDFRSGGEIGSVSAASLAFSRLIGRPFKRVANTLTIGCLQACADSATARSAGRDGSAFEAYVKTRKSVGDISKPDLANEIIALRILSLAKQGERDPDRLCAGVLATLPIKSA